MAWRLGDRGRRRKGVPGLASQRSELFFFEFEPINEQGSWAWVVYNDDISESRFFELQGEMGEEAFNTLSLLLGGAVDDACEALGVGFGSQFLRVAESQRLQDGPAARMHAQVQQRQGLGRLKAEQCAHRRGLHRDGRGLAPAERFIGGGFGSLGEVADWDAVHVEAAAQQVRWRQQDAPDAQGAASRTGALDAIENGRGWKIKAGSEFEVG